jgi:hypothetical protein
MYEVTPLKGHAPVATSDPIRTEIEAIDFALALPEVKSKVAPLDTWWGKAQKRDPQHPNRWFVSFGQGETACNTFYQCTLQVEQDRTVVDPFACSEGWSCK